MNPVGPGLPPCHRASARRLQRTMLLCILLFASRAIAQQTPQPPTAAVNSSITGVVRDKLTGAPLKDYTVSTYVDAVWANGGITMSPTTKQITSNTDEQGRYKLADLPAAQYHVTAQSAQGGVGGRLTLTRIVTIAGHDVDGIDFKFTAAGAITGKVLDENKEPVPNMTVTLVSKEYYLGSIGYFLKGSARTNDRGEYTIARVDAGHPYYLVAEMRRVNSPPHAETPLNPKMRRRVPMRTWYPGSPDRESAAPITLRPGERREGVDIDVKKSPSYCISGIAATPNGPAEMNVWIEALQPSSGVSGGGGTFMAPIGTFTGNDGEFRFCDLYPGSYRLTVSERDQNPDSTYAIAVATIADQDLNGLRLPTSSRLSMEAEVVLDGPQPPLPLTVQAFVGLTPLLRTQTPGERSNARSDIPGTITLSGLLLDDYGVRATVNSPGLYVKDVTYAGRSVRYEPLHLGSAGGAAGVRVTIGQDGATLAAKVTDKDGNPVANMTVIAIPAGTPSEGVLAARITSGQTDQTGQYTSGTLAPGKYFVVATEDSYDMTPESIGKLWQSHTRYQEVDLGASGQAQVILQPASIR